MRIVASIAVAVACVGVATEAFGAPYIKLATREQLLGVTVAGPTFASAVVVGTTAYTPRSSGGSGIYATPVVATAPGTLFSMNVSNTLSGTIFDIGSSFSVYDSSRQIFRVDKTTGVGSLYVNTAAIDGYVTANSASAPATIIGTTVDASGQTYFYDSKTKSIGKTTGVNAVSPTPVIPVAKLQTYSSTYALTGGLAISGNGKLYAGDSNNAAANRNLLVWDGTNLNVAISASNITSITGSPTAAFVSTTLFAAPDGNVYFYDNTSKSILSFSSTAANPASTLSLVLSGTELSNGPETTNIVSGFTWYNDKLAWYVNSGAAGPQGLYAIPEPSAMAPMLVAAMALGRRRRRA